MKTITLFTNCIGRSVGRCALFFVPLLISFALLPKAQAVSPPPDGGYPNFTTAEGDHALNSLTSGFANTAVGWFSLSHVTTGSYNTGVGAAALDVNTGNENTATGVGALLLNAANNNTANGAFALVNNTMGDQNTAVGDRALQSNTAGLGNTAIGYQGLLSNMTRNHNNAFGTEALSSDTGGSDNNAFGHQALLNNTGNNNTAIGALAGADLTIGSYNVCIGSDVVGVAGESNTVRIADNLPTAAGQSACYIGGILSNQVPQMAGNPIVTINTTAQQLGYTTDFADKIAEQQKNIEQQQASIAELKSTIAQQQKEMEIVTAELQSQAAQIQKVSAQLEAAKPAPQVVNNP